MEFFRSSRCGTGLHPNGSEIRLHRGTVSKRNGRNYTTTAEEGSLDECPMAYKDPRRILDFIEETVSDYELIKPVYNFKSC
jgi:hypothetical protein